MFVQTRDRPARERRRPDCREARIWSSASAARPGEASRLIRRLSCAAKATQLTHLALYQQRPAPEIGDYFKGVVAQLCGRAAVRTPSNVDGGSDDAVTSDGGD